jgi:hypothetical protein
MKIPVKFKKLSIADFASFCKIQEKHSEDALGLNFKLELASYFTGKSIAELESISVRELHKYLYPVNKLIHSSNSSIRRNRAIWVKGKRYLSIKDEKDLDTNQWMLLKEKQKKFYDNIPEILAILYSPTKLFKPYQFKADAYSQTVEVFRKHLSVKDFYGTLFFCSNLFLKQSENLKYYSMMANMEIETHLQMEVLPQLKELGLDTDGSLSYILYQTQIMAKENAF